MSVLVAGTVKEIDVVIVEDQVKDEDGNTLSVLKKRIVLDNDKAYFATGSVDVEIGQEVCFYLKEGNDKITKSIKKDETDSFEDHLVEKNSSNVKAWRRHGLTSSALLLINVVCLNDSYHRYLSSHDPMFNAFFYLFCLCICISMAMSVFSFSKWKKEKKKSYLSAEDKAALERFKSGLIKAKKTETVNMKIEEVRHV